MVDAPGAAPSLPPWRVERILYDDGGLLVVDKPVRVAVTGGDEANAHSLVMRLKAWLFEQAREVEPRVLLRLDEAMSGVVVLNVGQATPGHKAPGFIRAAHPHPITYLAVVERSPKSRLEHQGSLVFLPVSAKAKTRSSAKSGQNSAVHYRVLRENGARALVELQPELDRPEALLQLLADAGAPIVGDRSHGGAPAFRLMFHAQRFRCGEILVEAPTPHAFEQALCGDAAESPSDSVALRQAILDAACLRQPLLARTSAFRLINGEGDALPGFSVDAYGAFASLNVYDNSLLIRVAEIADTLIELGFSGVYLKKRVKADLRNEDALELAPDEVVAGVAAPESYCVDEFGMQINIELSDGLSTGLFVDMRDNRMKTRGWAAGGRGTARGNAARPVQMLNLFCYTCSFSVSAALSGAVTTSVDLAGKALERGRTNFQANGLDASAHRFIREDAMKFLARAVRRADVYDFIVLDPPSFATVGKGTFSVKNRYGEAVEDCLRILSSGGRLLCVTNHTKTTELALRSTIEAAAVRAGRRIRSLKSLNPGVDCPPHADGLWPSKSALCELE